MFRAVCTVHAHGDVMKFDSCQAASTPAAVVVQNARKRSLSPAPVQVRNGEPVTKLARSRASEGCATEREAQAIERLQELLHRQVPLEMLLPVASRSTTLVNALSPSARALLEALQSGRPLGQQQRTAITAGLLSAMHQSGLFERVS